MNGFVTTIPCPFLQRLSLEFYHRCPSLSFFWNSLSLSLSLYSVYIYIYRHTLYFNSNDFCVLCDPKLYPTISNALFLSLSFSLMSINWSNYAITFMWQELSCNTVIWETSSNFRIWYDFSIKKAGTGEELKVSLERWVTLFKIQLVNRNCRKQVFGIWDPHGFGWVLALQTPTNVSSPTSLGRWVSSQRSGEVTFPQLFVAREQSLPFLRIPFPGRSSGILSTSFRREAFSKGFLIPSEYRLDRFLCKQVYRLS